MIKWLRTQLDQLKIKLTLAAQRSVNTQGPKILNRNKKLKKYVPDLIEIGDKQHKLLFESLDKTDIEHLFAKLILKRQNEYFQAIILLVSLDYPDAALSIMRSLCDSLYLLKYTEIHPEYIKRFMDKTGEGGIRMHQIEKEIDDKKLIEYYDFLSNLMHSNPVGIKKDYYCSPDKKTAMISVFPIYSAELNESHIFSLIGILSESQRIIEEIYSKKWKSE